MMGMIAWPAGVWTTGSHRVAALLLEPFSTLKRALKVAAKFANFGGYR